MIYLITIALIILGVGWHVMGVVMKLRKQFPMFGFKQIFATFFDQEWDSLMRSFLVLCTYELFLFIIDMAEVKMPVWWEKYLVAYALALVLGYAGQYLFYKYLGTAAGVLEKKAESFQNNR